jgi:hypothetical protein
MAVSVRLLRRRLGTAGNRAVSLMPRWWVRTVIRPPLGTSAGSSFPQIGGPWTFGSAHRHRRLRTIGTIKPAATFRQLWPALPAGTFGHRSGTVRRGLTGSCARRPCTLMPAGGRTSLFDHLVGAGEQGRRNVDAKRLRGLQVDREHELLGLDNGQVRRLFAFENAPDIDARHSYQVQ